MWITTALVIRTVIAVLTIEDVRKSADTPVIEKASTPLTPGTKIYINPDGPLNFVYGYAYHEDSLALKMRLYSPAININYTLTKSGSRNADDTFVFDEKDSINELRGGGEASYYLSRYYKAFKELFNVVNNEMNIRTRRDSSFFMFLTKKLDMKTCLKLLASMLLLAEGVDVAIKIEKKENSCEESPTPSEPEPESGSVLRCQTGGPTPFLEVKVYKMCEIKESGTQGQDGSRKEEKVIPHDFKEAIKLINFFTEFGGRNIGKLDALNLEFNETPRFLIQYYAFELIETLADVRDFFDAVRKLLEDTGNGEGSKSWGLFFSTDSGEVEKYKPAYDIYEAAKREMLNVGFPFYASNPPPSNVVVKGYNRKINMMVESSDMMFSDCCDITIYTLLCCLFYEPTDKRYSLDHLRDKGYSPSDDLSHFFKKVCKEPVRNTTQDLHQKWTRVVQDLVLSEGELRGGKASGGNTIVYRKKKDDVQAEVKTELLNVLKIVAKVTGMPKERLVRLDEINSMVQDRTVNWSDVRKKIEGFITQVFQDISHMHMEIEFEALDLKEHNGVRGVYGMMVIKFGPKNTSSPKELTHSIRFCFVQGHATAAALPNPEVELKIKDLFRNDISKCESIEVRLRERVFGYANKFLKGGEPLLIPLKEVEKVEKAPNDLERYSTINKILINYQLETTDDKLYLIDLFGPYLDSMTAKDADAEEQAKTSKSGLTKASEQKARDPVVQLISNIMGSVPLGDRGTQRLFIQIFGFCNGEHKRLFPKIHGDTFEILPEFRSLEKDCDSNNIPYRTFLLEVLSQRPLPNTALRIWRPLMATYADNMFEKIAYLEDFSWLYSMTIRSFIAARDFTGIEAGKKVLKIKNGLIEPSPDSFYRAAAWFFMSTRENYIEGVDTVCNSWDTVRGDGTFLSALFRGVSTHWFGWHVHLSSVFLDEVYKDGARKKKIMEIYCHTAHFPSQFDTVCSLLEASGQKEELFETLYNTLERIIDIDFNYVFEMLVSGYPSNYGMFIRATHYIRGFKGFILRVDALRRKALKDLKEPGQLDLRFGRSFVQLIGKLDDTLVPLEEIHDRFYIQRYLNTMMKIIDSLCGNKDSQRELGRLLVLMIGACNRITVSAKPGNVAELDKEACEKLSIEEKIERLKSVFYEICKRLKAEGTLDTLDEVLEMAYDQFDAEENAD